MRFLIYLCAIFSFAEQIAGASLRKPPAFSTPVYSDSYLPATLQVIFHAVEQLRYIQMEEAQTENTTSLVPTTSSHQPGQFQPYTVHDDTGLTIEMINEEDDKIQDKSLQLNEATPALILETPEQNQETPEMNYATPETNYETPESVEIAKESQQSTENSKHQDNIGSPGKIKGSTVAMNIDAKAVTSKEENKTKKPSVESIVKEVYGLVKPTSKKSTNFNLNFEMDSTEKSENLEEQEEETRFTLLGEKVTQVPRPSLSSALRRDKIPPTSSLQQLALLYDALNKDARKQGFAKYAGYSDVVLKVLETSAGGGAGVQLQTLLEKTLERNELTRDDSKTKARNAYQDLRDPGSDLSTDLRRLLPLRFII